jgi:hypothetical protein
VPGGTAADSVKIALAALQERINTLQTTLQSTLNVEAKVKAKSQTGETK